MNNKEGREAGGSRKEGLGTKTTARLRCKAVQPWLVAPWCGGPHTTHTVQKSGQKLWGPRLNHEPPGHITRKEPGVTRYL